MSVANRAGMTITLMWVPSDAGIFRNEMLDECARWSRNFNFKVQIENPFSEYGLESSD